MKEATSMNKLLEVLKKFEEMDNSFKDKSFDEIIQQSSAQQKYTTENGLAIYTNVNAYKELSMRIVSFKYADEDVEIYMVYYFKDSDFFAERHISLEDTENTIEITLPGLLTETFHAEDVLKDFQTELADDVEFCVKRMERARILLNKLEQSGL